MESTLRRLRPFGWLLTAIFLAGFAPTEPGREIVIIKCTADPGTDEYAARSINHTWKFNIAEGTRFKWDPSLGRWERQTCNGGVASSNYYVSCIFSPLRLEVELANGELREILIVDRTTGRVSFQAYTPRSFPGRRGTGTCAPAEEPTPRPRIF